jgi:hypothetical protein
MRNPPAAFKHDDPTHKQYGQSADSSLLNKRPNERQNFEYGGVPIATNTMKTLLSNQPAGTQYDAKGVRMTAGATDPVAAQNWVNAVDYERHHPTADPMGGGPTMSPGAMLDKMGAGTNNPSIQATKDLAGQFGIDLNAQPQTPTQSRYPGGADPYGNGGYGPQGFNNGGYGNTTITRSGPVIGPQGAVYPSSQTNTYNSAGQEIGPRLPFR